MNININQKIAIEHSDGPMLVLAGPGSGKTFVLIRRIKHLIKENCINPDNILVITFTKAAATEMKDRFINLCKDNNIKLTSMPTFGTFHSIFFEILRNNFGYNVDSLLTVNEENKIISEILENEKKIKIDENSISSVIEDIKKYKISKEKEEKFIPKYLTMNTFNRIYNNYKNTLFELKKLDFYDMIEVCYEMLKKHKDILKYYQDKYKYILIDEFQDINKEQYDIVK